MTAPKPCSGTYQVLIFAPLWLVIGLTEGTAFQAPRELDASLSGARKCNALISVWHMLTKDNLRLTPCPVHPHWENLCDLKTGCLQPSWAARLGHPGGARHSMNCRNGGSNSLLPMKICPLLTTWNVNDILDSFHIVGTCTVYGDLPSLKCSKAFKQ